MRRNSRRYESEGINSKKVLYICGGILAITVIAFAVTFLAYGSNVNEETKVGKLNTSIIESYPENIEQASSTFGKTVNELEGTNQISEQDITNSVEEENINTTKYAINTSKVEESEIKETNTQSVTKTTTQKEEKIPDPQFKNPVEGEIIREYAKDKLIYSNTLEEWITHNGIDIKAEKTTVVKAAEEGTIKSIKNDPRYGLTVVIEHVNGFTSVYANLLTAEFVKVDEKVKEGQTIGTVGNTATFEIADEPHLHFEILKNGQYLDPELYINNN